MTFSKPTDESADCESASKNNSETEADDNEKAQTDTSTTMALRSKTTEKTAATAAAMTDGGGAGPLSFARDDWDEIDKALVKVSAMALAGVVYFTASPDIDVQSWALILALVAFVTGETVKRRI